MKFLFFICTDPEAEPYTPEGDNVGAWVTEMDSTGRRTYGDRLRPAEDAVTVTKRQGRVLATDGPFAETKEWIAGLDLMECSDLDDAVACASRHPMARFGRIEVRPYWSGEGEGPSLDLPVPPGKAPLFLLLLCTDATAEPYRAEGDDVRAWFDAMRARGVLVKGQLLRPVEDATLVRCRKGKVMVTDGPFAETKEWVMGFAIVACRDQAEAIEVASVHPAARFGQVEVRAFWPFG